MNRGTTGRAESETRHPLHYNNHPSGIECWDVVEHLMFNYGNLVKYVWRSAEKGQREKDLRKALEYIARAEAYAVAHDTLLANVLVTERDGISTVDLRERCQAIYAAESVLDPQACNRPLRTAMWWLRMSKPGLRAASLLADVKTQIGYELLLLGEAT